MVDVSVVLPVYNAGRFLAEAVDSILTQQGVAFELIAVDDASTDGSREFLERRAAADRRITLIANPRNMGHAIGINRGVEAARAPVVAIMHADDVAMPGRLAAQHRLLQDEPDIDVVGTWFAAIDSEGQPHDLGIVRHPANPANVAWRMHFDCFLGHPTVAARTSVFRANPYDPGFHGAEDYELWSRLLFRHRMTNIPEVLLRYRVHGAQVSQRLSGRLSREAASVRQAAMARLAGHAPSPEVAELIAGAETNPATLSLDRLAEAGEMLTLMIEAFLKRIPPTSNVTRVLQSYHTKLAALVSATAGTAAARHDVWSPLSRRGLLAHEEFLERSSAGS